MLGFYVGFRYYLWKMNFELCNIWNKIIDNSEKQFFLAWHCLQVQLFTLVCLFIFFNFHAGPSNYNIQNFMCMVHYNFIPYIFIEMFCFIRQVLKVSFRINSVTKSICDRKRDATTMEFVLSKNRHTTSYHDTPKNWLHI